MSDFHPELACRARILPRRMLSPYTLPLLRAATRLVELRTPSDVEVLHTASGARVRLHRPPTARGAGPALLWMHAGGYVSGSAAQDDAVCRRFARELGITVAAVQYRLAPEYPYPIPLEDCYVALTWLAGLSSFVDPARVAIGGASAGGGLAAALALLARDRGDIELAAQLLVYPMLDDRSSTRPMAGGSTHPLWSKRDNDFGWAAYLGDTDPALVVPARREDLAGLAPAWIGVGSLDLLHDDSLVYVERLRAAGVPCAVEIVPGAFHAFNVVAPKAPVSQSFFTSQVAWLRRILAQPEASGA